MKPYSLSIQVWCLWDGPNDPTSWFSCPCVTPSPWVHAGPPDPLLTSRLQQSGGCHFLIRFRKDLASVLLCFHSLLFAGTDETCCHVVSCPVERPTWRGTENGLWPVAQEEVNPVNNRVSELRSRSFLSWAFRWDHSPGWCHLDGSLRRELEVEAPTEPCQEPRNQTCLFYTAKVWGGL